MKTRKYYEQLFNKYPDVVTLSQFRNMLGGIGDGTARKLMRENRVKHYYIRSTYLIPKACLRCCSMRRPRSAITTPHKSTTICTQAAGKVIDILALFPKECYDVYGKG